MSAAAISTRATTANIPGTSRNWFIADVRADSLPGVASLDNLGLPESGDGLSDVMQEAKWEADCLAKLQDADGGFYYLVYPQLSEYEGDILPENGQQQVVWPKNTAVTAAAVAALAQCASSPRFKQAYPQAAPITWPRRNLAGPS